MSQDKIQEIIDSIKSTYYNDKSDFVGDGVRKPIFVKSYKLWELEDLKYIAEVDPSTIQFLGQAIRHQRYDVLEQLLPNHYRNMGRNEGIRAFRDDIMKAAECCLPKEKKTGALLNLEKFDNITGSPLGNPVFNQQDALRTLQEREVKMFDAAAVDPKLNQIVLNMKAAKEEGKQVA